MERGHAVPAAALAAGVQAGLAEVDRGVAHRVSPVGMDDQHFPQPALLFGDGADQPEIAYVKGNPAALVEAGHTGDAGETADFGEVARLKRNNGME